MSTSDLIPPVDTRFQLGPIEEVHRRFLDHYGFLHFEQVLSAEEVAKAKGELSDIETEWIDQGRKKVNGVPIFFGRRADGRPFVQRFAFASMFSQWLSQLINDSRFAPLLPLVGPDARLGETEKDGLVVNRYINERGSIYKRLGWHTDGLRDLFYLRMPKQMLNVGLHLDDVAVADGGLRLIPGTHHQGFFSMCFRKLYFVWHRADPEEICVETRAGDLTVHDGRLWHRVARSQKTGSASLRHSLYVPYLTGPVEPKTEDSPTPGYHHLGMLSRAFKSWLTR
jgi:phytanoyl-CoA hydroxylase